MTNQPYVSPQSTQSCLHERCLLIANKQSGFRTLPSPELLAKTFGVSSVPEAFDGSQNLSDYNSVIVCGGDGTISNAVEKAGGGNQTVYYMPHGTVNDFGKIKKLAEYPVLGKVNGKRFCYVLASGTLTQIGYSAKRSSKRRFGVLAYLWEAVKSFKTQRIPASIRTDGRILMGDYSLIMILRSPVCFGFRFNRLYNENKEELYLLLVRAPLKGGIVTLFFRYFRAFFLGFGKEKLGNVSFIRAKKISLELHEKQTFCLDGERYEASGNLDIRAEKSDFRLIRKKRKSYR